MRFRRKENLRKGTQKGRLLLWSGVLAFLVLSFFLYQLLPHAVQLTGQLGGLLLNHPLFSVREIKVSGGNKVGGSEIVAMAGLTRGMSVWKIDLKRIETKIAVHPWVKRALVRRELPDRIVIEVEERVALGIAILDKLYYVDSDGFLFKEVTAGEDADLPLITGLQSSDLVSQSRTIRVKIQEALRLAEQLAGGPLALSEIRFVPASGAILYPMNYPVALDIGWGDWQEKLNRLERVLALWKGKESRLAALDLNFSDQVVARLKTDPREKS